MAFYTSEWYDCERPGHQRPRYSQFHLTPEARSGGERLQHTTSYSLSPGAHINVYDDGVQGNYRRTESPYRCPQPIPRTFIPVPYPISEYCGRSPGSRNPSYGRRKSRAGDEVVEEFAKTALRNGVRSRSERRSEASLIDRSDFYQWRLQEKEKALEEIQQRQRWEEKTELKRIRELNNKRADEERLIARYEETKRKEAETAKADEIRIKEKMQREKREAEDKEEKDYEKFLLKLNKKEEEKKAKEDEDKEKVDQELKRRLVNAGYTEAQIGYILDEGRQKKAKARSQSRSAVGGGTWGLNDRGPVYGRVHNEYLSVDTLLYYGIPYEVDKVF